MMTSEFCFDLPIILMYPKCAVCSNVPDSFEGGLSESSVLRRYWSS